MNCRLARIPHSFDLQNDAIAIFRVAYPHPFFVQVGRTWGACSAVNGNERLFVTTLLIHIGIEGSLETAPDGDVLPIDSLGGNSNRNGLGAANIREP